MLMSLLLDLVVGGWLWRLARLGSSLLELFPKGADLLVHGGHVCLHHDLPLLPVVLESGRLPLSVATFVRRFDLNRIFFAQETNYNNIMVNLLSISRNPNNMGIISICISIVCSR